MRSRAVRLTLTLLAVVAFAGAAFLLWNIHTRSTADEIASRETSARLDAATRLAFELRAAQQAYVAAGQSEQFWIAKVTAAITALHDELAPLRVAPVSATALVAIEQASQALDEFTRMDRRARDQAASGQKLLASDLIFSDGFEASGQILAALDAARGAEIAAASDQRTQARNEQLMYGAGAGLIALVAVLLLAPAPRPDEIASLPASAPAPAVTPDADTFDLGAALDASSAPAKTAAPTMAPELGDVADVCSQLARLADTSTLPALLQRTALALDASGVVLWLADSSGVELTPVAAHGYPANVLSRMGSLGRDAENVTAAAFRTGLLQIVKADAMSNGAIAAPLVNQSGCIGVMSAEVRHEGETQPARLAIATIVAAQLATLVAPNAGSEAAAPRTASL